MRCHVCNATVGDGQRFCHECGQSLAGVTDPTQELDAVAPGRDHDVSTDADATSAANRSRTGDLADIQAIATVDDPGGSATTAATVDDPDDQLPDTQAIDTTDKPDDQLPDTQAIDTTDKPDDQLPDTRPTGLTPPTGSLFTPGAIPDADLPPPEPWMDTPHRDDSAEPDTMATGDRTSSFAGTVDPAYDSTTTMPTSARSGPSDVDVHHGATGVRPAVFDSDAVIHEHPPERREPFRLRPTFVLAVLALVATVMVSIADITDIRTDRVVAGIPSELIQLADIGSNLALGGFIGAGLMVVGGLLQCFGIRWGAGLAGGSGLAMAGWSSLTLGLAEVPIDRAERVTRNPSAAGPFTLTVTRDLGYWLLVAVAVVGLLVFIFSLTSAGTGRRRGLNPWTAALGALATVIMAVGPLITVGGADLDVNLGTDNLPFEFFAGRLVQIGLIIVAGVIGFLVVRNYGLGLAAGGVSVPIWLWLTSLLQTGDRPLGIGAANLGSADTSPHAVTTVGVALTVVMAVVAATLALVQRPRR